MPRDASGFTLAEALVTLAVVAIAATVVLPAMGGTLRRTRVATTLHLLTADLAMARGTAVMRHANVVACPGGPGATACAAGGDWSGGWIVFVDADRNLAADAGELLRATTPPAPGTLELRANRTHLRFLPDGRSPFSNQTISACADGRLQGGLVVNGVGRVRSRRDDGSAPCPVP